MIKFSFSLCFATLSVISIGQTVLLDENFSNGVPSNWIIQDVDQLTPNANVSTVTDAWVGFITASDTCMVSTSFYDVASGEASQSEDYLILPKQNLLSFGHLLSWESKSFDANYPEDYYVLLSTTDSLPESFTDTLMIVRGEVPYWKGYSINLFSSGFANQAVYIAFRNASENAFLLGIDNVKLTTNDPAIIEEKTELDGIAFYPNPTKGVLNFNTQMSFQYEIVSVTGEKQLSGMITNNDSVNLELLNSGTYFLILNSQNNSIVRKIIKQ